MTDKKLGWEAEGLLSEIRDNRSVSDDMIRHNRQGNALKSLMSRGLVSSTTYANGVFWLTTDAGDDYQFS